MFINLNGQLLADKEAGVPHDNLAFRYGLGLFETMLYRDGALELADYHWERLFAGMEQLHFSVPKLFTPAFIQQQVINTVKKNKLETLCRIRLQVWPGSGGLFDLDSKLNYVIECFPLDDAITQLNENGLVIGLAENIYKSCDGTANLKSCNAMIYAIAARQARENLWNDALLLNDCGNIAESTIANIFWVKDTHIYTNPLTEGCINGVMRRHILQTLSLKGFLIDEVSLTKNTLLKADEIFLTNAIRKVKWVNSFEGKTYSNSVIKKVAFEVK